MLTITSPNARTPSAGIYSTWRTCSAGCRPLHRGTQCGWPSPCQPTMHSPSSRLTTHLYKTPDIALPLHFRSLKLSVSLFSISPLKLKSLISKEDKLLNPEHGGDTDMYNGGELVYNITPIPSFIQRKDHLDKQIIQTRGRSVFPSIARVSKRRNEELR